MKKIIALITTATLGLAGLSAVAVAQTPQPLPQKAPSAQTTQVAPTTPKGSKEYKSAKAHRSDKAQNPQGARKPTDAQKNQQARGKKHQHHGKASGKNPQPMTQQAPAPRQ